MSAAPQNKAVSFNMIANTSSFLLATAISFFLTPYITKHIGIEAYGLVGLANSFISYITLFTSALNSMASRFIIVEIHRQEFGRANEYFSSVLIANTIIAFVLMIPSVWLIFNLDVINISHSIIFDAKLTFSLVFLGFFVNLVGSFFGVVLYAKNILYKGGMRTMESNILRVLLIILLFSYFDTKIYYVVLATFVAGLYPIAWNIRYTQRYLPELYVSKSSFSFKAIKTLISSGVWNSVTKLSQILLDSLDLLLCNIYIGGVMTGNVAIAKTLPALFIGLIAVLSDSFFPQFLELYSKKHKEALTGCINYSINLLSAIAGIGISTLIVFSDDFYKLWLPTEDSRLLSTITILSLGTILVSSCIYSLYSVFAITNKVRTNSIVMAISGVLSFSITLICLKTTSWGVYAIVGISSIVGIIRNLTFTPMYAAHCIGLPKWTFYQRILINLINVSILVAIAYCIKCLMPSDTWLRLSVNILFSIAIGLCVTYFVVLSKNQRDEVIQKIKNRFLKK